MELTLKDKSTICIDRGVFSSAGEKFVSHFGCKKAFVVTDSTVAPLYADQLAASLASVGVDSYVHIIPAGEEYKTLASVAELYPAMAKFGITRADAAIALGGGVVGDMTGFAAATYLRGIRVMQIPTTLLAQVDSSVGGKCGVDLPEGKNLVGAFHQPQAVLIDPDLLGSLPRQTYCDGMAEVIKYGAIFDRNLFDLCASRVYGDDMTDVISRCIAWKRDIVAQDELDTGLRMTLNFGHTFGHAIEKCGGYSTYTHGQGVAVGMVMAAKVGAYLGITEPGTAHTLEACLTRWHLPTNCPYAIDEMLPYIARDKKTAGSSINVILLQTLGKYETLRLGVSELSDILRNMYRQEA